MRMCFYEVKRESSLKEGKFSDIVQMEMEPKIKNNLVQLANNNPTPPNTHYRLKGGLLEMSFKDKNGNALNIDIYENGVFYHTVHRMGDKVEEGNEIAVGKDGIIRVDFRKYTN